MHSKNVVLYCGQAVQRIWTVCSITTSFVPSPAFCTHFVRSLCVNSGTFALLMPLSFTRLIVGFFPVSNDLYSLPTGPTISTIFLNKNSFNNKIMARSCV